ncbi:MAG: peptide-binding protein [Deltaproteobacteria bacterium]|nr:peptide-binding protein [Deltaproteobacteria bacterium]
MPFSPLIRAVIITFSLFFILACGEKSDHEASSSAAPKTQPQKYPPAYGDAIVTGSIGDASNLLPVLASDSASGDINGLIYDGLLKTDKNLNLIGNMAESWEISEDGLTITFRLRKGVKWHDGHAFTSKDVMFTYQLMIDPKTPTAYGEDYKQVKKAETPDDYTFRVTYERPYAPALISWSFPIMPAHLLQGRDITKSPLTRKPIGTGPYIFKEWQTGQKIILEASPDYFEGRPYIFRYVYRIIPDTATMFLELKSGGLDRMDLTPIQYKRQTNTPKFEKDFKKYQYLSFGYTYLGFNLLDPKFQDKRVRQAIGYAIDKNEIIDGVLLGLGQPANGPYKPGTWVYNEKVTPYPFDPEKAKMLLAAAGWADTDHDGLLDKDGQPFKFTITTNQGNKQREMTALIIQQRLKDVGIGVKVRIIEWAAFLKEFIDKKKFEAVILGWTIPINPDLFDVWHSSKTKPGELNFVSYQNREVDRLIDQGRFTFDREVMKKSYDRIQEILKEDAPYIFLYVAKALPVVAARFHGIKPAPAGIEYNFIKWYVPKHLQKYKLEP